MKMQIDTHIHTWNIEKVEYEWLKGNTGILNRNYLLEELEPQMSDLEVNFGILVQAANNFEDTRFMLEECEKRNWLKGVVGWLPLMEPGRFDENLAVISNPNLKGIRHLIHDEPNPKWLIQPEVIQSLAKLPARKLTFDVVAVLPEHLECVLRISEKHPEIKWCIDHLGHPPANRGERFGKWGVMMKELSGNPNIVVKISGLGMSTSDLIQWKLSDIQPYVEFALEHFEVKRAMIGGDWPVVLLCGGYAKSWNMYHEILSKNLADKDLEQIYAKNAIGFYQLSF